MLYKQAKLFKLTAALPFSKEELQEKLEMLRFRDCPASMLASIGWVPPVGEDEEAPLLQVINGYLALCLQMEEKILPAVVVRQELTKKIKLLEARDDRKIYSKEKNTLKDELITTLLPRAFTKISQLHAFIDMKNNYLIISTTNEKRIEQFVNLLKKSIGDIIEMVEVEHLSHSLTHWLQHQSYPKDFAIEKSCVLQDQNQTNRVIRCQQQDLFAASIQSLIKDGCLVKQVAMEWQDHVGFVLSNDFSLSGIRFKDELIAQTADMEAETKQQKFIANFFILTESLTKLYDALIQSLQKASENVVPMAARA